MNTKAQGIYSVDKDGLTNSHTVDSDHRKGQDVTYKLGDVVSLKFDPSTGQLTYTNNGKSFTQATSIRSSTTKPVHFCAVLYGPSEDMSVA